MFTSNRLVSRLPFLVLLQFLFSQVVFCQMNGKDEWNQKSILVKPFFENQEITPLADRVGEYTHKQFETYGPPKYGLIEYRFYADEYQSMAAWGEEHSFRPNDLEKLDHFVQADYVLTGEIIQASSQLLVFAKLKTPDGLIEQTFTVSADEDLLMAGKLSGFILANLPGDHTGREKYFEYGFLGKEYPSTGTDDSVPYDQLDPIPAFTKVAKEKGEEVFAVSEDYNLGKAIHYGKYLENGPFDFIRPYDSSEFPARYLIYVNDKYQQYKVNNRAIKNIYKDMVTRSPSSTHYQQLYNIMQNVDDSDAEMFQQMYEKNTLKMPSTPVYDYYRAMLLQRIAWSYRGGGFISTVTDEGIDKFKDYNAQSIEILERLYEEHGPLPSLSDELISAYGNSSQPDKMTDVFDETIALYPNAHDAWNTMLHYSRPRWFGNREDHHKGIALINRARKLSPQNSDMLMIAVNYHFGEIALISEETSFWDDLDPYLDHRGMKAHFESLIQHGLEMDAPEGKAFASFFTMLKTDLVVDEIKMEIIRNHQDILYAKPDSFPMGYKGVMLNQVLRQTIRLGDWEFVQKIAEDFLRQYQYKEVKQLDYYPYDWDRKESRQLLLLAKIAQKLNTKEELEEFILNSQQDNSTYLDIVAYTVLLFQEVELSKEAWAPYRLAVNIQLDDPVSFNTGIYFKTLLELGDKEKEVSQIREELIRYKDDHEPFWFPWFEDQLFEKLEIETD